MNRNPTPAPRQQKTIRFAQDDPAYPALFKGEDTIRTEYVCPACDILVAIGDPPGATLYCHRCGTKCVEV